MKHYEIVIMVHPDQSEQVPAMTERYSHLVTQKNGAVHRVEDWGRRQLAYPINKIMKAHYLLLNIECDRATLEELTDAFRYNDAVIRYLIQNVETAVTEASPMLKERERESRGEIGGGRHDREEGGYRGKDRDRKPSFSRSAAGADSAGDAASAS